MSNPLAAISRRRLVLLAIGLALVPVGFWLKYYRGGDEQWWANNWGSSLAYEWFFMSLSLVVWPRRRAVAPVAIGVALATMMVEFGQLCQAPWLVAIRSTFVGRTVLGNSFSWWDLPAYPMACALGAGLLLVAWPMGDRGSLPGTAE